MPTSPDSETYRPERFVAGGDALGHAPDGRVTFVRGGIPGDLVTGHIEQQGRDWSRVVVDRVLESSPDRVEPPCPQRRAGCGGCDWQHIRSSEQLRAKVEIVRDAMRRTGRLPGAQIVQGESVPTEGYRTTVRIVGDETGRASFRMEKSNETVGAAPCLVAHPSLQPLMESIEVSPGLEVTLRVSVATGEATAAWNPTKGDVSGLPEFVARGPGASLLEVVAGKSLQVSARSFFQSGPDAANLLVDAVSRNAPELDRADIVLDAYAGVGLFAATAAHRSRRVIALESSKFAVGDALANLSDRVHHVEEVDVGRWSYERSRTVDVAIADPSRSGLGRKGVAAMISSRAPVMVLVSCDPVALSRDTALLAESGYVHERTEVHDVFPHTHHVECVSRFVKS